MAAQLITTNGFDLPGTEIVNGLRHQIFSGAAFTQDEDSGVASRHQLRHVVNPLHGRRSCQSFRAAG